MVEKEKCLTCGGAVFLNHATSPLCRDCGAEGGEVLAVPLYCLDCCNRENKCANCGSQVRRTADKDRVV